MIEEQYISFETAKLAKEKGFVKICCEQSYGNDGKFYYCNLSADNTEDYCIAAPTQSLLARWLREKYHLLIVIYSQSQESWQFHITHKGEKLEDTKLYEDFESYEDAMENALQEALNNLA